MRKVLAVALGNRGQRNCRTSSMRSRTSPPQSARAPQWQLLSPGHHNVLAQTEEPVLSRCLQKELSLPHLVLPAGPGRLQPVDFQRGCPETHSSLTCLCLLAPHSLPWCCGALVSLWAARVHLWATPLDGHTSSGSPLGHSIRWSHAL